MEVIDLFDKIANGEEPPKKIKIGDKEYEYVERVDGLYNYKNTFNGDYLSNEFMIENILNYEVEIIEDNKKIEKLKIGENWVKCKDEELDDPTRNELLLRNKINEIIDRLNKGDK